MAILSERDLDAVLIFPPVFLTNGRYVGFFPLGTAALAGFLKEEGLSVRQLDLNLEFMEYLGGDCLQRCLELIGQSMADTGEARDWSEATQGAKLEHVFVRSVLDDDFVFQGLFSSDRERIVERVRSNADNIYHPFFERSSLHKLLQAKRVKLLGFSILGPQQVLAALTLAYLAKQQAPHLHICFGGPWISLHYAALRHRRRMLQDVDSLVVSDGETALCKLIRRIQGEEVTGPIPNLVDRSAGELRGPFSWWLEDMNSLPAPDFSTLRLDQYFFGNTITYQTSRGCYWHRCDFCENLYVGREDYRIRDMMRVANDLKQLKRRHQVEHVIFCDEAIPPQRLRSLSEALLEEDIGVDWSCFARPEEGFTQAVFREARKAGCTTITFGLESASKRLQKLMHRGVDVNVASRVIRECSQQKIDVVLGAIIGLPTETLEEARQTIDFVVRNLEYITVPAVTVFRLRRNSRIYRHPDAYDIEIREDQADSLRQSVDFVNKRGISQTEAADLLEGELRSKLQTAGKGIHDASSNIGRSYDGFA